MPQNILQLGSEAKYITKGSIFISFSAPISNISDFKIKHDKLKNKYKDANHICYAYRLLVDKQINDFATDAGVGWNGKSTVQIHPKLGTWFFLAELVTTLNLNPDQPMPNRCGTCTKCIDCCPTDAITAPNKMDPRRCISYFTIEHKFTNVYSKEVAISGNGRWVVLADHAAYNGDGAFEVYYNFNPSSSTNWIFMGEVKGFNTEGLGFDAGQLAVEIGMELSEVAETVSNAAAAEVAVDLEAVSQGLGFSSFSEAVKAYNYLYGTNYTEEEAANAIVTSSQSNPSQFKKVNEDKDDRLINLLEAEMSKIKNYVHKTLNFHQDESYKKEVCNIHECLIEAIESINKKYFNAYKIIKDFDPSIPKINFNGRQLSKCFENLLLNSCESKKNNIISITTRINHDIYVRSNDLQKVLKLPINIKISDEGNGIAEDIEEFIFYPFVGSKDKSDGLGLAYVNTVISKNGGFIKLEKEKGSVAFNIYLPLNNFNKN